MACLQYKTRGQMHPQGKTKVYFCCHPADFKFYFEAISDDILKYNNCSVWYDEKPEEPYDEEAFFADLSQMKLFVMPVTYNLLCTKNRAIDVEYEYAVKNHIPVLPLLQEKNLVELFNERCGDLQYLDKNTDDKTAIGYYEKLKKYLDSVLLSDELTEKIRASFDAYVFLSYRKKDRRYAQELMRLIHKNDFCRDIAIWYDEFLVPGENFNNAIKEALDKSNLFAMVVTPNLVNEQNYVMQVEYPMAKNANKSVLAAEMYKTDRDALNKCFDNLGTVTDAYDSRALSDALIDNFRKLALDETPDSPEHIFFIGLAYLTGIDVEVDTKRAVELISCAAEAGLPEAIEKIAYMYSMGDGVARDWDTAIKWKRELIEVLEKIYSEERTPKNCEKLLYARFDLATLLRNMGKWEEAIDEYKELEKESNMSSIIQDLAESMGSSMEEKTRDDYQYVYKRIRALSLGCIGEIYKDMGDLTQARDFVSQGVRVSEHMLDEWNGAWLLRDVSTGYITLGNLCMMENDKEEALDYYMSALEMKKYLVEKFDEVQFIFDLGYLQGEISETYKIQGKVDLALEHHCKYTDTMRILMEDFDEYSYTLMYCFARLALSDIYKMKSDMESCGEILEDTLKLIEKYEEKYECEEDYIKATCFVKFASFFSALAQNDKRKEFAFKAILLTEKVSAHKSTFISKDVILDAYMLYGISLYDDNQNDEALLYCLKAIDVINDFKEKGIYHLINDYIIVYNLVSAIYIEKEQLDVSKRYMKEAEELIEKAGYDDDNMFSSVHHMSFYGNMGDIYLSEENVEKTEEYYQKALNALHKLKESWSVFGNATYMEHQLYYNLGYLYSEKDAGKAINYFKLAVNAVEEIPEEKRTIEHYDLLCMTCYMLWCLCGIVKRRQWQKKCEEVWGYMCDTYGDQCYNTNSAEIFLSEE